MNMFAEKIRMRPSARNTLRPLLLAATILPTALCAQSLDTILGQTELLESNRDPKCEATAARLEDFIYGTPLTQEARFRKHDLQVNLVSLLWSKASAAAQADKRSFIDKGDINKTASQLFLAQGKLDGSWRIVAGGDEILISARDFRQYTSVAYALRAVLAVQQEQLFGSSAEEALLELSPSAVDALKLQVDLFTLATLNRADRVARAKSEHELTETRLVSAWNALAKVPQRAQLDKAAPSGSQQTKGGYPVLTPLIERKIASYEAYNQISGPIFLRNIQVYFARHGWPSDEEKGTQFKAQFTELMIQFSRDLLLGSQQIAAQAQHPLIRPADVGEYARRFVPHEVNAYEDVIFFPRLQDDQRVTLEAYDLDAFRDPGLHWRYLQAAMESVDEPSPLEPDPFAAELLVENIAQFGVLVLRLAGEASREQGHKASGIDYQHRSADWLARRLRTYTPGEDGVGNATIPPAFGGSGLAAEDIDNDGHVDLLFLGGAGARLYRNQGDGSFKDVSREMGLQWNRKSDGLPGEMRQPIIADLDNDGWQDVVITYVDEAHRVYRNLQGKGFEDVTEKAALGGAGAVGGPATVADFNNDGLLDIYIGYFGDYVRGALPTLARRNTNGGQNRLYFGKGDFKFVDVSKGSGTEGHGWTQAVGHTDFDGDGLQDLIEGNDFGVNAYYRNLGDRQTLVHDECRNR